MASGKVGTQVVVYSNPYSFQLGCFRNYLPVLGLKQIQSGKQRDKRYQSISKYNLRRGG